MSLQKNRTAGSIISCAAGPLTIDQQYVIFKAEVENGAIVILDPARLLIAFSYGSLLETSKLSERRHSK